MKSLIFALLLVFSSAARPDAACESKLGTHAQSLVTISEEAYKEGVLTLEDLRTFSTRAGWRSPRAITCLRRPSSLRLSKSNRK
jgi:hypothetical protein